MKEEEKKIQPMMVDVVTDARMSLCKICDTVNAIGETLTSSEILDLKEDLEQLSIVFMMLSMDAELNIKEEELKNLEDIE